MDIAVVGTGSMGRGLARVHARAGHAVHLGSRDPLKARSIAAEIDPRVAGAGNREAAERASIVYLAFHSNSQLLDELAPALAGKIVVEIASARSDPAPGWNPLIDEEPLSAQEEAQERLPRARVLGAFQSVWAQLFDDPSLDGKPVPVFVVGDDRAAKASLIDLVRTLPFEPVDAGPLRRARTIAALYGTVSGLQERYRTDRDWKRTARAMNALLDLALRG